MNWGLTLIEGPEDEPVSLDDARPSGVHDEADDPTIERLITAARKTVEFRLNRTLLTSTWLYTMERFPGHCPYLVPVERRLCDYRHQYEDLVIELPRPPLRSVTSITYLDPLGAEQTLDPSAYTVDTYTEPGRVVLKTWMWPETVQRPGANVRITYEAGFDVVPEDWCQAIILLVAHFFENPEATSSENLKEIPWGVDALLDSGRWGAYP